MGISFSTVLEENESQLDANAIFELYSLERNVYRKLEEQAPQLYITALHDECLPIVCAVHKTEEMSLNVDSSSLREEVTKRINLILRGEYLEQLITLMVEKLKIVLDIKTVVEETYTYVVFANRSILRIDLFVYYSQFRAKKYKNILAYFLQVGLLDIAKARPQVLIYELTRATDEEKLNDAWEMYPPVPTEESPTEGPKGE